MTPTPTPTLSPEERIDLDRYMQAIRSDPPTEALFGALRLVLRHDLAPQLTVAAGYVDLAIRQSDLLDQLEPLRLTESLAAIAAGQQVQTAQFGRLLKTIEVQAAQLHQIAGDVAALQVAVGAPPSDDSRSLNERQHADAVAIRTLRMVVQRAHRIALIALGLAIVALVVVAAHVWGATG